MFEIKLTISLDERTQDTIDRLIASMNKEVTIKVAEVDDTNQPTKKKVKAPIKATATPIEDVEEETAMTPQDEPQQAKPSKSIKEDTEKESITIEELRALLAGAKREKGTDAIKAILNEYDVALLSNLKPEHYAEVAKRVRAL